MADDPKQQEAENRTELAEDRTVLANERTFAGWMRTGFAAVAIGVGFHALFERLEPAWAPKAIATSFLLVAIYTIIVAERRACKVLARFDEHQVAELRPINLRVITIVSVAATSALIAAIWLLKIGGGSGG